MHSRLADVPRSTVYFLVSFPLGVAYAVFLAAAAAAGAALLVFVVGAFVLAGALAVSRRVAVADAALAARLFGLPAPALDGPASDGGLVAAAVAEFGSASGYRAVAYLLVRFVAGVAGFVAVVTWLALSAAFVGAPLYYDDPDTSIQLAGVWEVETLAGALAVGALGVAVAVAGAVVVGAAGRVAARASALVLTAGPGE
ncbi:MAG: sensor domain-containing protein [Halobacterium sp.]